MQHLPTFLPLSPTAAQFLQLYIAVFVETRGEFNLVDVFNETEGFTYEAFKFARRDFECLKTIGFGQYSKIRKIDDPRDYEDGDQIPGNCARCNLTANCIVMIDYEMNFRRRGLSPER